MNLLKVGLLVVFILAARQVSAETRIVFNNFLSPNDHLWTDVLAPWIKDIEAATQNQVRFIVPDSSLAPPSELLNAVQQGVMDGAFQMVAFLRESNPELQLPLLPMTFRGNEASSVALWRTYERFFKGITDLQDVELLGLITAPGGSLYSMKPKPFQSLADLGGVKMWSFPGVASDALAALGAVVTPGPAVRMYEVISGGVVDAFCCLSLESLEVFEVDQFIGAATEVPGQMFAPTFAVFVRRDVWDSIPPEDQAKIRAVSGLKLSHRTRTGDEREAEAEARALAAGIPIEPASAAFVKEIEAAIQPVQEAWFAAVAPLGIDGKAALSFYLAEQDKVAAGQSEQ